MKIKSLTPIAITILLCGIAQHSQAQNNKDKNTTPAPVTEKKPESAIKE
jgi:hypothetical protein